MLLSRLEGASGASMGPSLNRDGDRSRWITLQNANLQTRSRAVRHLGVDCREPLTRAEAQTLNS
jgi:hypothetical protein